RDPTEWIEDQVPRPDVVHLATAEPGLEMCDAARRQAPQVVARRAALLRAADRFPLEEIVGAALRPRAGHTAVRRDDPRPAADEEQGRLRLTVGRLREQQPSVAGGPERVPDIAVRRLGADEEAGPLRRLAIDAVEVGEAVALGVDDADARLACPVDVLPPLLAQVRLEGFLVGAEVDDP